LKLRYPTFETVTRASTLDRPTDSAATIIDVAGSMLDLLPVEEGVRLLGVGATSLTDEVAEQLSFDDLLRSVPQAGRDVEDPASGQNAAGAGDPVDRVTDADWEAADLALDEIRGRFGRASIGPARLVDDGRLRPKVTGQGRWGPGGDDDRR
jgi:hypothetical protein